MIFIVVMLLVFSIATFIKPKCPDCGGKMDDVDLYNDHAVYKCRDCGKEWI